MASTMHFYVTLNVRSETNLKNDKTFLTILKIAVGIVSSDKFAIAD